MKTVKIAICQMTSIDLVDQNLQSIFQHLENGLKQGAELYLFPENSLYLRIVEGEAISGFEISDPVFQKLADWTRRHQKTIQLGSIPLRENGKLTNATVAIEADGQVHTVYRKMHLFDIQLEGQRPIRESDVFNHGPEPKTWSFGGWKFGQSICYDLRFSELFSHYANQLVDVILVPSAFLVKTGEAHWEVLLRARAIESQCYVLAAAQAGTHRNEKGSRSTYGHSLAIDPWGKVIAKGPADGPATLVVELSRDLLEQVRRQIPMQSHRRL